MENRENRIRLLRTDEHITLMMCPHLSYGWGQSTQHNRCER